MLTTEPAAVAGGTVAVTVNVSEAPLAIVPPMQVTTCPAAEHDVPGGAAALTKVRPAGSVSTTETPVGRGRTVVGDGDRVLHRAAGV